jgi:hypothetical protein
MSKDITFQIERILPCAHRNRGSGSVLGQTRSFGDVGSSDRFARKRTRLDNL